MFINFYLRVGGGVSKNDFVMQLLSTLTGQSIERPVQVEMSCLGAAFLAGLAAGTRVILILVVATFCSTVA
jgi:glycerol kinase